MGQLPEAAPRPKKNGISLFTPILEFRTQALL